MTTTIRFEHPRHVPPNQMMVDGKLVPGVLLQAQAGERLGIDCGGWREGPIAAAPSTLPLEIPVFHKVIRKALMDAFPDGAMIPISIEAPTYVDGEHVGWHRVLEDRPKTLI